MSRSPSESSDLAVVRRAGRIVAIQTAAALAAVLLLVGAVISVVYVRGQNRQISEELTTVAMTADDVDDPPPGMELVLRNNTGAVATSDGGKAGVPLLAGPTGFSDLRDRDRRYRALVADRPYGRVVVLMDMAPYQASRARLFGALALAALTGIIASIIVVVVFTRRSVSPLARALALQRRFVADASHELRAPLTVLHTRAQLLASRLHTGDVEAAVRDADALVADTRVLSGVVDDLLASATLTAGGRDQTRVDMVALSRSVCDGMTTYAESLGVGLECTASAASTLEVIGSEAALRRAVTALVDNALGHQNSGGTVEVDVRREGQQIFVSVCDDGIGIDEATMATLFDRFARGPERTERGGRPSYGIGLALVREIVAAHNGRIDVASRPGQGAMFTIALPAAAPPGN